MLADSRIKAVFGAPVEGCGIHKGSISDFSDHLVEKRGTVSSGLSCCGYDLTLGSSIISLRKTRIARIKEFFAKAFFRKPHVIDTKNLRASTCIGKEILIGKEGYVMLPGESILGVSQERIQMPLNIAGVAMEKSTLARIFLNVTVTPLEPGWEGFLTFEAKNNSDYPIRIYAGMGFSQLMFTTIEGHVDTPYNVRNGKYQNQPNRPVMAR